MKRGLSSSPPACNAPVGTLFTLVGTLFYIFDVLDLKSEKCHILCEEKKISQLLYSDRIKHHPLAEQAIQIKTDGSPRAN
jgi:hypothetical protein